MKRYFKSRLTISIITLLTATNLMANSSLKLLSKESNRAQHSHNFALQAAPTSGKDWCTQHKLLSNCFPLNNQLNNSIHVSIPEFKNEIDFPANVTLRFADVANPPKIKSCKVTITSNKTHSVIYQGNFNDMVGLICSDNGGKSSCKAWEEFK
ncbi:hypothetical protein [Parashewanella tropica]|uniref:hypothetical protein n=1 Tax=Parashewanella tropica TaxID=2547970 RepID=UPI001059C502|nr:hypothetical protein [Parashewanella tropica]